MSLFGPVNVETRTRKGVILAGGTGSRLYPLTRCVVKQLLPVYDKPLIYYPLSVLMLAGVTDVLIISLPSEVPRFRALLGDGSQFGLRISWAEQTEPRGIAEAVLIARDFTRTEPFWLALGDNIIFGQGLPGLLTEVGRNEKGATVFCYPVSDARAYGVVEVDKNLRPVALVEKPERPRSRLAVIGLYHYDSRAADMAAELTPSGRGELEITDLNRAYMSLGDLSVRRLGRGTAWLDAGTPDDLLSAASFVQAVEKRQGLKIACLEEIAYQRKLIDLAQLEDLARDNGNNSYGQYLREIVMDARDDIETLKCT